MPTIERNYRKNPHTASFLQTFHSGISSTGRDYRAEMAQAEADLRDDSRARIREVMENGTAFAPAWMNRETQADDTEALELEAAQDDDLLDLVPETEVIDARTSGQVRFMESLIERLTKLDSETGRQAREFTDKVTAKGGWTPGRGGNASEWIDRMISREMMLSRKASADVATVADGRYAVEEDGVLRFFRVKNGRKAGFVFLDVQASDEWYSIRSRVRIKAVLDLIARDPKAAMIRYGHELGICGMCGRTLTDEASRAAGIGPICASK